MLSVRTTARGLQRAGGPIAVQITEVSVLPGSRPFFSSRKGTSKRAVHASPIWHFERMFKNYSEAPPETAASVETVKSVQVQLPHAILIAQLKEGVAFVAR